MILVIGLLAVTAVVASAFLLTRPPTVEINGVAMSEEEIQVAEDRVLRAVQQQGGDEADVRAAAVDALRDDMALLAAAGELGVTDVTRPAQLLDRRAQVNEQRTEAQQHGEVVYGPVDYDVRTFYAKALTDIRTASLDALGDVDGAVQEEDVRARFDAQGQEWSASASTYRLTVARSDAELIPDAALFSGDVSTLTVSYAQLQTEAWNPEVAKQLQSARPGDLIGPVPSQGDWLTYRLDGTEIDAELAYRTYRQRIRAQLLDELLDERISAARHQQDVRTR